MIQIMLEIESFFIEVLQSSDSDIRVNFWKRAQNFEFLEEKEPIN